MFYIKIVDGNPVGYPISEQNVREALPSVSFPSVIQAEDLVNYGYVPYQFSIPPDTSKFEVVAEETPELVNGVLIQQFTVREMGEQEKQVIIDREIQNARNLQKSLLADSDWTEFQSVRSKHSEDWAVEWDEYRTLLRDVDKQDTWPFDLEWPKIPTENPTEEES
jgi:hypothetical protein